VRFIVMCEKGHLDEFPWDWWVKHEEMCPKPGRRRELRIHGNTTAGLAGLILACLGCDAKRSMEGCFNPAAIPGQCQGRRPWLGINTDETCGSEPRVAQRGASNIYFSVVESALDIPPWSDDLQKKIGMRWAMLEQAPDQNARRVLIQALRLVDVTGKSETELVAAIEERVTRLRSPNRNIRWEEYQQFVQHTQPFGENTEFEIRPAVAPPELAGLLQAVTRATRLREVRAIRGFTRMFPPTAGDEERVARISLNRTNWLPAVENRGEGIFIHLRLDRVRQWEAQVAVVERAATIRAAYEKAWVDRGRPGAPPKQVTPRLLLVHSLSHALIRQLSLSCGYGSASLRERLYVDATDWEMAGLLVFTSSPDADGTLGGLARQGENVNIVRVFEESLTAMTWCSSDPLCIEGVHATSEPASGAACHACMLTSETSCEEFNTFLDRAFLVGTPSDPDLGYFADYLRELRR
jgi:flavin-binding protein dodecin